MKLMMIGLMLVFLSCNGQKRSVIHKKGAEIQQADVALSLVLSDNYSGSDEAETLLIKDEKRLQKFYSNINRTRKPGLPIPKIDFSSEMVIVRCSGRQIGSSMPELYVIQDSRDELVIGIKKTDGKSPSSAITNPFSVYKMPLTKKEVIIMEGQ